MITRRHFMHQSALMMGAATTSAYCHADAGQPNIVMIYVDDLGWKDVGYMGSTYYETPAIDRIAREGVVFTNAYSNAPNCAPSRACLMTGQHSPRHGIYTVGSAARGQSRNRKLIPVDNLTRLHRDAMTLPHLLKQAGYACAHVGKWHLGEDPCNHGFDVNYGGGQNGAPGSYFAPYRNVNLGESPEGEFLTERLTREAVSFMKSTKGKPFFLNFSHYSVHTPLQAREETIRKYEQKATTGHHNNPVYAAMLEHLDDSVRTILETLDEMQCAENTIVIFYSDNGGYGPATSMHPLRGAKGMMYEGGIRVPLAIRWPASIQAGRQSDLAIQGTDFLPTLARLAGADLSESMLLDGVDFSEHLFRETEHQPRSLYWHFPAYLQRYSTTDGWWRTTPVSSIRNGDYKLLYFYENQTKELYNLKDDISETTNRIEQEPDRAESLYADLNEWLQRTSAYIPRDRNPEYDPVPFTG